MKIAQITEMIRLGIQMISFNVQESKPPASKLASNIIYFLRLFVFNR